MIKKLVFLTLYILAAPCTALAVPCSKINLTKCLDSACAINISANPAARCQYCGTADAGEPADAGMKSISAGTSSKNTISVKDLKKAPTDPGERYVWATKKCLEIVPNCNAEDVSDTYDKKIEDSCKAAGIANDMASIQKKLSKNKKTASSCTNDVSACITKPEKCDSNYSKCADDKDFDSFIASCLSAATGCTEFTSKVRDSIASTRTSALTSVDKNIDAIVAAHKNARAKEMSTIKSNCSNNTEYDNCIARACQANTSNNCATSDEKKIATNLCQFYKTACTKIK